MSKKFFVCQGMNGKTDEDVLKERQSIVETVLRKFPDAELLDTMIQTDPKPGMNNPRLHYLGHSIQLLGEADFMVVSKDFANYSGCNVERFVATLYDIPCYTIHDLKQMEDR